MTWIRLSDDACDHPKVVGLSDRAFRCWVRAICYCGRHLTDGALPRGVLARLGCSPKVLEELVGSGLFERKGDDILVHGYLDYQSTRAQVLARREAVGQRVKRHRGSVTVTEPDSRYNGAGNGGCNGVTVSEVTHATSHPIRSEEDLTCTGGAKDLPGESPAEAPRDTPAHFRNLERSFWPTVEAWPGPNDGHRDFARQNGLDVGLEAKQFRANRLKNGFRCADFHADFEEWLAKSLKFARTPRNGSAAVHSLPERELSEADKREIAKARRAAKRAMEA